MERHYLRRAMGLLTVLWVAWLVTQRFLSDEVEIVALVGGMAVFLLIIIVFALRQSRRDDQTSNR